MMRLGLDFGGVIVAAVEASGSEDTALGATRLEPDDALPVTGAFEAVAELVRRLDGRVWIVSKAGPRMQEISREWLEMHRFFERTGFAREHLHFCLEREGKRPICDLLGLTHFVDDRIQLMHILRGAVPHLFQLSNGRDAASAEPWFTRVLSWRELLPLLCADIERTSD